MAGSTSKFREFVVESASNTSVKIHTAPSNSILYYGTAQLRAQSKEEAQLKPNWAVALISLLLLAMMKSLLTSCPKGQKSRINCNFYPIEGLLNWRVQGAKSG